MLTISLIYFSNFGNNKILAENLAEKLSKAGARVILSPMQSLCPKAIPSANIYIFCAPSQIGTPPLRVHRFLQEAKLSKDAKFVLVSTCADPAQETTQYLYSALTQKGLSSSTDSVKVKVMDFKGPLERNWEEKMDALTAELTVN